MSRGWSTGAELASRPPQRPLPLSTPRTPHSTSDIEETEYPGILERLRPVISAR
jgi:hypothetical protein